MSLKDELKNSPLSNSSKHVFLAMKDDIQESVDDGYSYADIWKFLTSKERISISYRSFTRYCNLYLKRKKKGVNSNEINTENKSYSVGESERIKASSKKFEHSADPNKDQLI